MCASQEMAMRALKQTGSRNIEAALEYISKMGYLDPRNELIVRVIKQTSPGTWKCIYGYYLIKSLEISDTKFTKCTTLGLAKYAICIVHKNSKTNLEVFDFRLFRYEGKIGQL